MKTIELSNHKVTLKEKEDLRYKEIENIQRKITDGVEYTAQGVPKGLDGEKMIDIKRMVADIVVKEIIPENGGSIEFTDEWLDNLPGGDGLDFMDAVEQCTADIGGKKKAINQETNSN